MGTTVNLQAGRSTGGAGDNELRAGGPASGRPQIPRAQASQKGRAASGQASATVGFNSQDMGSTIENAQSTMDIVNYDVRESIAAAEHAAARSDNPAAAFSRALSDRILGSEGMRNRYLQDADNGRATFDASGPLTSREQNSVLSTGSFSTDIAGSLGDGDSNFKTR